MRIGIFSECYRPTINGVVISIDTFRKELEKRGHKYFIFAPGTKGYDEDSPDDVFRFPSFCWPGQSNYPICLPQLAPSQTKKIYDLKLDIIHTQHLFNMGQLGLKVGRKLNIPVVHTYHTLIAEYTHYIPLLSGPAKKVVIGMSKRYCNACDQIVTPSPSMKKILENYGVTAPIEPIPTGVDLKEFDDPFHPEVLKAKLHIPEDQKILLYVSRIAKEKNLDFLFSVVRRLAKKRKDFHLVMVGGGPELKYYQQKIYDWDLLTFVTFTGMLEPQKRARFMGAADVFVFPSVTETQGIVITESMAAGVPAVAVDKMGPSDIILNGIDGFLPPLKTSAFLDKIEKLLDNDKLRKKMGRNAKENAKKFSVKASGDKMEKLYERTINSYRSRQGIVSKKS